MLFKPRTESMHTSGSSVRVAFTGAAGTTALAAAALHSSYRQLYTNCHGLLGKPVHNCHQAADRVMVSICSRASQRFPASLERQGQPPWRQRPCTPHTVSCTQTAMGCWGNRSTTATKQRTA
jgi:hypothetical protein